MAMENPITEVPRSVIDDALKNFSSKAKDLVSSDNGASYYAYAGGVVRIGLAFLAGKGVGWASGVTGDEQTMIAWIFLAVVMLIWSLLQKKLAAIHTWWVARTSAAVSAHASISAGTPVAVPVEPPPSKI